MSNAQQGSSLAKDMSISSALLALIAHQEEENAAAERTGMVRIGTFNTLGSALWACS